MNKDLNSRIFSSEYIVDNQEEKRLEVMLKLVGTGKDVLDVGCRDGAISKMIEKLGNHVEAVEISEFSIRKAIEKGLKVFDLDLNSSDWAEKIGKKYDLVFAAEVLEHLFETDLFLKNIYNVLKPGGILILSTPNLASLGRRVLLLLGRNPVIELNTREGQAGHVRYFVYEPLKGMLKDNGFKVVEFTSDVVNFGTSPSLNSTKLARLLPTFGRSLIVKAVKND